MAMRLQQLHFVTHTDVQISISSAEDYVAQIYVQDKDVGCVFCSKRNGRDEKTIHTEWAIRIIQHLELYKCGLILEEIEKKDLQEKLIDLLPYLGY